MSKRLVVLESPFRHENPLQHNIYIKYARLCLLDSLLRGEAPLASHLLYTQVLNDSNAASRDLGIAAGLSWQARAFCVVFYVDWGMSDGMERAFAEAKASGLPCECRYLGVLRERELETMIIASGLSL